MQRDYSHFKPSTLTQESYLDVVENAVACFRENGKQTPRYDSATLFQAVAFFERIAFLHTRAQRETPPRTLTDEEFCTRAFAIRLEFFTDEFKAAEKGTLALMNSVFSITSSAGLLASCFLNPMSSQPKRLRLDKDKTRSDICVHALNLSLSYSQAPWTQEIYDNLMDWYPPALLLCANDNIPPMCAPIVRMALDLYMSLDNNPVHRFNTMKNTFKCMVTPGLTAAAPFLALPAGFSPT